MYADFFQKKCVHTQIKLLIVAYWFYSMEKYVREYQIWKACTYVEVFCNGCIHMLGFCWIWCLISLINLLVFDVYQWSLSCWSGLNSDGWGWMIYGMICWIVMMLLSICGSEIYDWFCKWFSEYFSMTMIQFQVSVFWDMYIGILHGKHIYTQIYLRTIAYIFWYMVDQGLQRQNLVYVMSSMWIGIMVNGFSLIYLLWLFEIDLGLSWYSD